MALAAAHTHERLNALSGYRSDGRMAGEGNPTDPAQARLQVSRHVKVVGLLLVCAASALMKLPVRGRRKRAEYLLGHLPNLTSKGKGERSMVGKQGSTKICSVVVPASPVRKKSRKR